MTRFRTIDCPECDGTGEVEDGDEMTECSVCEGLGEIEEEFDPDDDGDAAYDESKGT